MVKQEELPTEVHIFVHIKYSWQTYTIHILPPFLPVKLQKMLREIYLIHDSDLLPGN